VCTISYTFRKGVKIELKNSRNKTILKAQVDLSYVSIFQHIRDCNHNISRLLVSPRQKIFLCASKGSVNDEVT